MVKWILLGAGGLLLFVLLLPGPRDAFNLGPIGPVDWAVAVAAGFLGVAWFEVYKVVAGRPRKRV
jgi:Ca2+-transporting ATPase